MVQMFFSNADVWMDLHRLLAVADRIVYSDGARHLPHAPRPHAAMAHSRLDSHLPTVSLQHLAYLWLLHICELLNALLNHRLKPITIFLLHLWSLQVDLEVCYAQ